MVQNKSTDRSIIQSITSSGIDFCSGFSAFIHILNNKRAHQANGSVSYNDLHECLISDRITLLVIKSVPFILKNIYNVNKRWSILYIK
jgi:hypothetical protein